ncbi:unnamed protein product [Sphagnum balticum]
MSSLGIVIIIALFFIVVNHGVITDPNDGMARLWNDLFKNGEYLKHTGPWRNGSIVERVYFEADLRSIEKVGAGGTDDRRCIRTFVHFQQRNGTIVSLVTGYPKSASHCADVDATIGEVTKSWSECTEFDLVNYTVVDGNLSKSPVGLMDTVTVTIALRRYPSYYAITFVMPTLLITSLALFGSDVFAVRAHMCTGMFIPGTNHHERNEKCTLGVTALLTLAIMLLMVADMMPRSPVDHFSLLGKCVCQRPPSTRDTTLNSRYIHDARDRARRPRHTHQCRFAVHTFHGRLRPQGLARGHLVLVAHPSHSRPAREIARS